MNIAVFIAREVGDNDGRAEFPRYGKWFNSHKIYTTGTESKFPYWWEKGREEQDRGRELGCTDYCV